MQSPVQILPEIQEFESKWNLQIGINQTYNLDQHLQKIEKQFQNRSTNNSLLNLSHIKRQYPHQYLYQKEISTAMLEIELK